MNLSSIIFYHIEIIRLIKLNFLLHIQNMLQPKEILQNIKFLFLKIKIKQILNQSRHNLFFTSFKLTLAFLLYPILDVGLITLDL